MRGPYLVVIVAVITALALIVVSRHRPGPTPVPREQLDEWDPERESRLLRFYAKHIADAGVLDGRWTAAEAAAIYRAIDRHTGRLETAAPERTRLAMTEDEALLWLVAHRLRMWALSPGGSAAAAGVADQTEAQLQDARRNGGLRLPDPPAGAVEEIIRRARTMRARELESGGAPEAVEENERESEPPRE